jgi:acetyl-CoA C-acetyltransferase
MYIVEAKRTPVGKFLGSLAQLSAEELLSQLFTWYGGAYPWLKQELDSVIIGNVVSAGTGMNIGRAAAYGAGFKESVPGVMVNQVCGSGLAAVIAGVQAIKAGDSSLVLAGGVESMSNAPHLLRGYRQGFKLGNGQLIDSLHQDGLFCQLSEGLMGEKVNLIIKKYDISRKAQDDFAYKSHQKAVKGQDENRFEDEIIPIRRDGELLLKDDEQPRKDTSVNKLGTLKRVFKGNKTVTAGNASPLNDGAALLLVASEAVVQEKRLQPKARVVAYESSGVDPEYAGMGAASSIKRLMEKAKVDLAEVDLFEINEAFAAQTIAVIKELNLDQNKVNVHGGALALGHPLGASGARILTTLVHALAYKKKRLGIASLCVGGGQGVSILVERL